MNRLIALFFIAGALAACSKTSEYSPDTGATGEEIFAAACAECHKAEEGHIFELEGDEASPSAIANKINKGGLMMTAFPEIKGESLDKLTQFVLANNKKGE